MGLQRAALRAPCAAEKRHFRGRIQPNRWPMGYAGSEFALVERDEDDGAYEKEGDEDEECDGEAADVLLDKVIALGEVVGGVDFTLGFVAQIVEEFDDLFFDGWVMLRCDFFTDHGCSSWVETTLDNPDKAMVVLSKSREWSIEAFAAEVGRRGGCEDLRNSLVWKYDGQGIACAYRPFGWTKSWVQTTGA